MYIKQHPWFDNYTFTFSTNGINYNNEKVQCFINKNIKHLQIGLTIDGTRHKMTLIGYTKIVVQAHIMML